MWCWCVLAKGKKRVEAWLEERKATVGRAAVLETDKGNEPGWEIVSVGPPKTAEEVEKVRGRW